LPRNIRAGHRGVDLLSVVLSTIAHLATIVATIGRILHREQRSDLVTQLQDKSASFSWAPPDENHNLAAASVECLKGSDREDDSISHSTSASLQFIGDHSSSPGMLTRKTLREFIDMDCYSPMDRFMSETTRSEPYSTMHAKPIDPNVTLLDSVDHGAELSTIC
jgi:hypothetical protein